jgi:hypothetical protein
MHLRVQQVVEDRFGSEQVERIHPRVDQHGDTPRGRGQNLRALCRTPIGEIVDEAHHGVPVIDAVIDRG